MPSFIYITSLSTHFRRLKKSLALRPAHLWIWPLVCLLVACSDGSEALSAQNKSLRVVLMWHDKTVTCNDPLLAPWHLAQLQFYLSNFTLNDQPITLKTDADLETLSHQQKNLLLLGGDCQGKGNWTIDFEKPLIPGLMSFELGVPFKLNHGNPLKALPPLNQSDMFWTWQQGHKFLRLDLNKTNQPNSAVSANQTTASIPLASLQTGWQFHLGSIGCQSASVMRAPLKACHYPNRAKVELAYQGEQKLILDLAPLLTTVLNDDKLSQQACMSDPQSLSCQPLFNALGINSASEAALTLKPLDSDISDTPKMWRFN
jgi:uncharacterized repeat protein (TIGR04052 family)